jgi:DNA-binding GntR family transcriptional regulator
MLSNKVEQPKANLTDKVREDIERYIVDGTLRPDQHLVEAELAKQLGISRTPLREALRQLEIKGYLSRRNSVGYSVARFTIDDIREVFELREALEGMAARLACERVTPEQLRFIEYYLSNYDHDLEVPDPANFDITSFYHGEHDWNNSFHEEIYRASGNKRLFSQINDLRDVSRFKRVSQYFRQQDLLAFQQQHHDLFDAIKDHDPQNAEKAVASHLRFLFEFYVMAL